MLSLLTAPLLCGLIATSAPAAELKKPGPSPSDALFDPSRVIQIEIRLDPKDWHALRISHPDLDENLQPIRMNYEYYRGDVLIDGQLIKSVGMRKKSVWGSTARPSFKIKFDEYVKNQEFSGLEMLTLNNFELAPTKAHQSLVYSFMNRAGAIAPRSNLARVVVNGEDLGIYGHVESIDKRFIKRHFNNAQGDLYEGQYRADFTTNMFRKIEHKWGKDDHLAHVQKLTEVLESPGRVSLKSTEELVHLDGFITFWAAQVLLGQGDGYPKEANNYYFYRDTKSGKFFFIPWGADIAFAYRSAGPTAPVSVWAGGFLCRRLWELPEVREKYRTEMRRLLTGVWNEKAMLAELSLIRRQCQVDRPERVATDDNAAEQLARRIEGRRNEVQAELDAPPRDWPLPRLSPPRSPPVDPNQPPMLVEGSFSAVIAEAFPTNVAGFFGQGSAAVQFTVAGKTRQPFTRLGAVAVLRADLDEPNLIRLAASDDAGVLRWEIRIRMDPYRVPLRPGAFELGNWTALARLVQGDQIRYGLQNTGTLELTQVSTNLGGTISGKFKINTTAFEEEKMP